MHLEVSKFISYSLDLLCVDGWYLSLSWRRLTQWLSCRLINCSRRFWQYNQLTSNFWKVSPHWVIFYNSPGGWRHIFFRWQRNNVTIWRMLYLWESTISARFLIFNFYIGGFCHFSKHAVEDVGFLWAVLVNLYFP